MTDFYRAFPLEDIAIRATSDGRTVEAYAAVFDAPQRIVDAQGEYYEVIDRSAFNKTLADKGTRFGVFYNHGRTIWGTPSDAYSMPIGTPVEIRADARGLLTVTKYNKTPVAEQVLEGIRTGAITAQSFSGSFVRSDKKAPRGGFRAGVDGSLETVTRQEIAMREYGPTPFPAYEAAAIVGVRAEELARTLADMDPEQRAEIAALLQIPVMRLDDAITEGGQVDEPATDATPVDGAGADAPTDDGHAARLSISFNSLRREAREKGVL